MGSPELPNDTGEDDLRMTHVQHPPVPSDDSDNETLQDATYDGYQPLAMDENYIDYMHSLDDDGYENGNHNSGGSTMIQEVGGLEENKHQEIVYGDPNIPKIERADVEIEREVWSQPRPEELQIELDVNKTQQILNAMANFQLPNMAVPDWAAGIPEERWKEELLQRIQQKKSADVNLKGIDKK